MIWVWRNLDFYDLGVVEFRFFDLGVVGFFGFLLIIVFGGFC